MFRDAACAAIVAFLPRQNQRNMVTHMLYKLQYGICGLENSMKNVSLPNLLVVTIAMICSPLLIQCNSDKPSRAQAQQLWHALNTQSDPTDASALLGGPVSRTCSEGGHQEKHMGLVSVRGDALQLRATLHYVDCGVQHTQSRGELFVGIRSVGATRGQTNRYDSTLTGELVMAGRIPLHCVVDLTATRPMGGTMAPPTYAGTFCGYDAATLGI